MKILDRNIGEKTKPLVSYINKHVTQFCVLAHRTNKLRLSFVVSAWRLLTVLYANKCSSYVHLNHEWMRVDFMQQIWICCGFVVMFHIELPLIDIRYVLANFKKYEIKKTTVLFISFIFTTYWSGTVFSICACRDMYPDSRLVLEAGKWRREASKAGMEMSPLSGWKSFTDFQWSSGLPPKRGRG